MKKEGVLVLAIIAVVIILIILFPQIKNLTGYAFNVQFCQNRLNDNPNTTKLSGMLSCLEYCEEYESDINSNLESAEGDLQYCYQGYDDYIAETQETLDKCYLDNGNTSSKCNKYVNKIAELTKDKFPKCDKKYTGYKDGDNTKPRAVTKYENMVENCDNINNYISEFTENYAIYSAYQESKGTTCTKIANKKNKWNPLADVNKDGKVGDKDKKLIKDNLENETWGQEHLDITDLCIDKCAEANGTDYCQMDEACPNEIVDVSGSIRNCCSVPCSDCQDSDDSKPKEYTDFGIFTAGNVTDKLGNYAEDSCYRKGIKSYVKEYYCDSRGIRASRLVECKYGRCIDGACQRDKCSDGVNRCVAGAPLCEYKFVNENNETNTTLIFDCNCVPSGYYKEIAEIQKVLRKPFADRADAIEEAMLKKDTNDLLKSLPGTLLGAVTGLAGAALGTVLFPGLGTVVGLSVGGMLGAGAGGIIGTTAGGTISDATNLGVSSADVKKSAIYWLAWFREKTYNIHANLVCDAYQQVVYLDCEGSALCKDQKQIFYPTEGYEGCYVSCTRSCNITCNQS